MAGRKLSKHELQAQTQRYMATIDVAARVIVTSIKWGVLGVVSYFAYKSIESLSGKTTLADIGVKTLGDMKINQALCIALAGGTSCWAYGERRLRRKKTAELSKRTKELELKIDKDRSSSMLPATGQTRGDDQ